MSFSLEYAPEVQGDFRCIATHLLNFSEHDAVARIETIEAALRVLMSSPFIGRRAGVQRELLIGSGSGAYVARYRVLEYERVVLILAIRHAREDGFKR